MDTSSFSFQQRADELLAAHLQAIHQRRADEILAAHLLTIHRQTDRLFAVLFVVQWIFAILCALIVSPRTWIGAQSEMHIHVWAAFVMGGMLSIPPILMAVYRPGATSTRMVVAVAQMLYSGLLIHLTGGRIETHFHVFGSLAVMAFYRDWRVFIPATLVIATDHLLRGVFWPESVFGVAVAAPWRVMEHAGWVLFEDVFLIWGCLVTMRDLRIMSFAQAQLEDSKHEVDDKIIRRSLQLKQETAARDDEIRKRKELETQLLQAQKLESIGQLAAGIAHEINTPMQFVSDNIEFLDDCSRRLFEVVDAFEENLSTNAEPKSWESRWTELGGIIERNQFARIRVQIPQAIAESREGIERVINIVRAMKEFSHPGREQKVGVDLNNAVRSTMNITRNRWKYAADLELDLDPDLPTLRCVAAEVNQVLLNLIVNAADAISEKNGENSGLKGLITVRTRCGEEQVIVEVEDTGGGIPDEIRSRIFDPFFTTKDVGKGTGQGLAITYNVIVNKHGGTLDVESMPGVGSLFRVSIPIRPSLEIEEATDASFAEATEPARDTAKAGITW